MDKKYIFLTKEYFQMRKTRIDRFEIFLLDNWRANFELFSSIGEEIDQENFRVSVNLPIKNPGCTPDEIKNEVFDRLKATVKEISAYLEMQSFDSIEKR